MVQKFPIFKNLHIKENYPCIIEKIKKEEFKRIQGMTYVDHAGSALYSEAQLEAVFSSLSSSVFGNPHSRHLPSDTTTEAIESVRNRILGYFKTNNEEYDLIFTSGATEAISLVANSFNWSRNLSNDPQPAGCLVYTQENHTSILGLRGPAHENGAQVHCIPAKKLQTNLQDLTSSVEMSSSDAINCLFAYPGQCNFSGTKYPLSWIPKVQKGGLRIKASPMTSTSSNKQEGDCRNEKWFVLMDAASLVATSPLDLSRHKPDFVPISFYKIFGYPTGLGCLLVSKRAWPYLRSPYFGGGTVLMVDSRKMEVKLRNSLHERFENGTLPFLDILSLDQGFDTLMRITGGMENIEQHVFNISRYLIFNLLSLRHENGSPVVEVYKGYQSLKVSNHGSIVNFNVKDSKGNFIGYSQVEKVSSLFNVHLRTGCVCNPGACQIYLNISSEKLMKQFQAGHVCGDSVDLVEGLPTGSVRVSFGYMSNYDDADAVLKMVTECFVEGKLKLDTNWLTEEVSNAFLEDEGLREETCNGIFTDGSKFSGSNHVVPTPTKEYVRKIEDMYHNGNSSIDSKRDSFRLTDIIIYPVKSCAGISVVRWPLSPQGLDYDRQWMIVNSSGVTLTQKRIPKLSLLKTSIDLEKNVLVLSYEGCGKVSVSLDPPDICDDMSAAVCGGRVCGDRVKGRDCGSEVADWLSSALKTDGLHLIRQTGARKCKLDSSGSWEKALSLANESQYLIIHRSSMKLLIRQMNERQFHQDMSEEELKTRFRPNFVVEGGEPYEEDNWRALHLGQVQLKVIGNCSRCQMVCVNPYTGERSKEPMMTLGNTRGPSMKFGIHSSLSSASGFSSESRYLKVGTKIVVET